MAMDLELKQKWVEALRSGEYQQGHGSLYHNGKYCCLGVLCEIHPEATKVSFLDLNGREFFKYTYQKESCGGLLPLPLAEALELEEAALTLVKLNDQGKTFPEIADWIEEHV